MAERLRHAPTPTRCSQSVTIPAGCSATLSFWLHIDSAETTTSTAYDKLTVKIGTTTLATYSNLNKATGYSQKSFNVSSFAGQTVTISFSGVEDSSLQTSVRRGRHGAERQLTRWPHPGAGPAHRKPPVPGPALRSAVVPGTDAG